jgi:hypothetical protein
MTPVSSSLIELLTQQPTGSSSAFQPDYLYLVKFLRTDFNPLAGIGLRTGAAGDGTVMLAVVSDQRGVPNEVLFKTELSLPRGNGGAGEASLVTALPKPLNEISTFWLGFRFSTSVQVYTRLPVFVGSRSVATVDFGELTGSLLNTAFVQLVNDDTLGMPILFPIFQFSNWGG